MELLYFDCFAGVSGDMCLGGLIDLGVEPEQLERALALLPLEGYRLQYDRVSKNGISGVSVTVEVTAEHHHRNLSHIRDIIDGSTLPSPVKETSLAVFLRLAEAEAKVHHTSAEKIHFHEVGAVDAIVDIVGTAIGLDLMGVEKVMASPLPLGCGFVTCTHGRLPVPAPATVELLKGVPVYSPDMQGELVTPTGAALITAIASSFGPLPPMVLQKTGYGAGKRDLPVPNLLRLILGEG